MTTDNLAAEYADTMVASIASIMGRVQGTEHDDECERGGLCFECDAPMIRTIDDTGWACPNDHGDYVSDHAHVPDPCDCAERASDELSESYALEVVAERGEPFSVLLTFGGPNAWVEWAARQGTDSAALHVAWGVDTAVRRSQPIRDLAAFYAEMMGAE